jgi:hypothetical protein
VVADGGDYPSSVETGGEVVRRFYSLILAIGLATAACGGTTATTTSDAAAAADDQTATTGSETTDPGAGSEDGELTLADFIGGVDYSEFDEADFRAQELEIQQQVAECMAAEGFEYIPFVPSDIGGGFAGFDEEEYVKTYGFGVSTWVLQQDSFGPESDPYAQDPNQDIVEAMDDAERDEYYRLLYGGEPDIITNTPPEELEAMSPEELDEFYNEAYRDWQPDGCYNEASADYYNDTESQAFYEEFGDDLDAFYSQAESDPRMTQAQADWSACMADKGHDFASQEEMYAYFYGDENGEGEFSKKVNELITWPDGGGGFGLVATTIAVAGGGSDSADSSADEPTDEPVEPTDDGVFEPVEPEYDIEELQPYIDEEIAVATANYECSMQMRSVWEEVYQDLEQQFIEQNLDRLTAFKAEHP